MRTLIIGDIHGCMRELQLLIAKAGIGPRDRLVAVGDLVDRGPRSDEVVDFLATRKNTLAVMGNHERKHVRWALGQSQATLSQRITRHFCASSYIDMLGYFQRLPTYLELPDGLVVHAALEPGVAMRDQAENVLTGATSGEQYMRAHFNQPWHALYRGRRPVFYGHHDQLHTGKPFVYRDRVFGLDTSCYKGGRLTGIVLPERVFVSVPARIDYWAQTLARWARES